MCFPPSCEPIARQKLGAAGGEAPNHPSYLVTSFFLSSTIKIPLFLKQSGHLDPFKGALIALMALRSQLLWPAMVLVNNCYAQQPKLILSHWSCVFLFVRSAIAGCRCFSSSLTERSATVPHRGVAAPISPHPPSLADTFSRTAPCILRPCSF